MRFNFAANATSCPRMYGPFQKDMTRGTRYARPSAPFVLPGTGYNPTVDYLRMIAAILIVLFHAHAPAGEFSVASVGIFAVFFAFFTLNSARGEAAADTVRARAARLLRPWATWSALYAALILGGALTSGESVSAAFADWLPPHATQYQLWFLPWAFAVGLALVAAAPLIPDRPDAATASALLVGGALLSAIALLVADRAGLPEFFALWALYVPSALAGGLAHLLRRSPTGLAVLAGGSVALAAAAYTAGLPGAQQLLLGVPAAVLALCLMTPASRWSRHLGKMSMDVYLVHAAVIAVLVRVFDVPTGTALCGVLAVAISFAFSATLRGVPFADPPRLPRALNAVRQALL